MESSRIDLRFNSGRIILLKLSFTVEDAKQILEWAKKEEERGEGVFLSRAREAFMTQISTHWFTPGNTSEKRLLFFSDILYSFFF